MKGKFLTVSGLILAMAGGRMASAEILSVPGDFHTIEAALAQAQAGDRIELAAGTYFEYGLMVPSGVALAGLGSQAGDVVIDAGGQGRILTCESNSQSATITGITFLGGRAAGETAYDQSGGAILVSNSAAILHDCQFVQNTAEADGGAVRFSHGTGQVLDCRFLGNTAGGGGGGIECSFSSSPRIEDCSFHSNNAGWGGAVSVRAGSRPQLARNQFDLNQAVGSIAYGGAIFADNLAHPLVRESTFYGNRARYGGAVTAFQSSPVDMELCTLAGNVSTTLGGGVFCLASASRIEGCIIAFSEGTGASALGTTLPTVACTDIYGSSRGDWVGDLAVQAERSNNLNVDPVFCTPPSETATRLLLDDSSPLGAIADGCGQIGAWPAGCDFTYAQLSGFAAEWIGSVAYIRWRVLYAEGAPEFRLTRATAEAPWSETDVPFDVLEDGSCEGADAGLDAGSSTWIYRLYLLDTRGEWSLLQEVRLAPLPAFPGIGALSAWPNPFNPMTTIHFSLGRSQRVKVAVYDLTGRLLVELADQVFSAGPQSLPWQGLDGGGRPVGSGTYLVLVQGERDRRSHKLTLLK